MKKLLFITLLLLLSLVSFAQKGYYQDPNDVDKINYTKYTASSQEWVNGQSGWALVGNTCNGCASFFYKIERTTNMIGGYYWYYIYFWSNSNDSRGNAKLTYFQNFELYSNGQLIWQSPYILVPLNTKYYVAYIYWTTPNTKIGFKWQNLTLY